MACNLASVFHQNPCVQCLTLPQIEAIWLVLLCKLVDGETSVDTDLGGLLQEGVSFLSLTHDQRSAIEVYLLQQLAGLASATLGDLMELAKCFCGFSELQLKQIQTSVGCSQYPIIGITWNGLPNNADLGNYNQDVSFSAYNFPFVELKRVTRVYGISSGAMSLHDTASAPDLVTVVNRILLSASNFKTLLFPKLITSPSIEIIGAASLSSVSLPVWLPSNGGFYSFRGCALTAATVNHLLARGVANPAFVSGTMELTLGTNAAPTGQGITDKNTLIARGVTVTTN